jgi:DNA-binding transcriptional regulator YbjK
VSAQRTPRQRQILDAAQVVVGDQGLRGLTHRAVDREAGIAQGSTSAYFRTREALQLALAEHTAAQLLADSEALAQAIARSGGDQDQLLTLISQLFEQWLDRRARLVTRLEMTVQATRDPALAAILADARQHLVDTVRGALVATGKRHDDHQAETVVAVLDGVLLGALLKEVGRRATDLRRDLSHVLGWLEDAPHTP